MTRLIRNNITVDVAVLFSFTGAGPLHGIRVQGACSD